MDDEASNVCDVEEVSSAAESLDENTRTKLAVFPAPKVSTTGKGIASNHMDQMTLLE